MKRTKSIRIRTTEQEYEDIKKDAVAHKMSVSAYILSKVAHKVLDVAHKSGTQKEKVAHKVSQNEVNVAHKKAASPPVENVLNNKVENIPLPILPPEAITQVGNKVKLANGQWITKH